jgi:hypothetical protein
LTVTAGTEHVYVLLGEVESGQEVKLILKMLFALNVPLSSRLKFRIEGV